MSNCLFSTNIKGGYFFGSEFDFSAYQGWTLFFEESWDLFKVLDSVSGSFKAVVGEKSLLLESSVEEEFFIDLDFRWIHDFCDKGRIYEVFSKKDFLVVKYTKYFDDSLSKKLFSRFLVIRGLARFDLLSEWVRKDYPFDAERGALSSLYVFRLLKGSAKKLTFGFGLTEEEAVVNSLIKPVERVEKNFVFSSSGQKKLSNSFEESIVIADNAFSSCVKLNKYREPMIFAGYPWFYQVWARDECISLIGLFTQGKFDVAKKIILRNLKRISDEGILPNRFPDSVLGSADAAGWLFQRIRLALQLDSNFFSSKELSLVEKKLDSFLDFCKKKSYKGLVHNGPKETWMDTVDLDGVDTRSGARVEIQALYLSALDLKVFLVKRRRGVVSSHIHKLKKKKSLIRSALIKDNILYDGVVEGVVDKTPRPNVFLAFYAYPNLAMKKQWFDTFEFVLGECWLDWGGLSSIGKNHYLFKDTYSGMSNESYHRGDSWFFVNNIAALSLYVLDKKHFKKYIFKICDASTLEMRERGFINHCAEVSSAKSLESKGCLAQAWSAATLLELLVFLNDN